MGVPGFFIWLLRKDKFSILQDTIPQEIDYLFLDANGLIHPQCFKVLADNYNFKNLDELERKMLDSIIEYIHFIVNFAKPKELLYIAIDGVAPMAKIKHQRIRRYKSVIDTEIINNIKQRHSKEIGSPWSNACITPGTDFMNKITKKIIENANSFNCKQTVFSSAQIPGEGEHKIMSFIREQKEEKVYAVYGLDADLIFLSVATNKNNIYLLRETSEFKKHKEQPFIWVNIDNLKKCIKHIMKKETINDFIFICYLLGNDFLPNIETVNIYEGGIDKLLDIYNKVYSELKEEILTIEESDIKMNIEFLKRMFSLLAKEENQVLKEQWRKSRLPKNTPSEVGYTLDMWNYENINFEIYDPVKLGSDVPYEWQQRYYKEYFSDAKNIPSICQSYMEGLYWIARYYFINCHGWRWYYPYDHSPLISTLSFFLNNNKLREIKIKDDKPISPMEQLLIVIPQKLKYLIPSEYAELMTTSLNESCPVNYNIDYVRKRKNWQGIPILPSFDYKKIHKTITERNKKKLSTSTTNFLKELRSYCKLLYFKK